MGAGDGRLARHARDHAPLGTHRRSGAHDPRCARRDARAVQEGSARPVRVLTRGLALSRSHWYDGVVVSRIAVKTMGDVRSGRIPRRLLLCFLALAFLVFDAAPGSAQWPEVERWLDGSQPVTLGLGTSRFRVSALGTKPGLAIEDPSYGGVPYRLIDSDLYGRGISFDLKLRRSPSSATGTSVLGAVDPDFAIRTAVFDAGSV